MGDNDSCEEALMRVIILNDLEWIKNCVRSGDDYDKAIREIKSGKLSPETKRIVKKLRKCDNIMARNLIKSVKDQFNPVVSSVVISNSLEFVSTEGYLYIMTPEEKKNSCLTIAEIEKMITATKKSLKIKVGVKKYEKLLTKMKKSGINEICWDGNGNLIG